MNSGNISRDEIRLFFDRVRGIYPELFALARCVTGDEGAAEQAVQRAMCRAWQDNAARKSLRRYMRLNTLRQALAEKDGGEWTYDGPLEGRVGRVLADEMPVDIRLVFLRFGCSLPPKVCERLTGLPQRKQKAVLYRLEREYIRVNGRDTGFERECARFARAAFAAGDRYCPELGSVYRKLEAELIEDEHPIAAGAAGAVRKVLYAAACAILVLLFWLAAALLGKPTPPAEEETPSEEYSNIVIDLGEG